jgi:hypothetical protein
LAEALALPAEERAKLVAKLSASLAPGDGTPRPMLLDLAGRGTGLWGDDSTASLERMRDEWR